MYLPPSFREDDPETLFALIRSHPLGTLVVAGAGGLEATPLPFLVDAAAGNAGESGLLRAHLTRANPILAALAGATDCLVVFGGTEGYVTPSWYASKQETGRVVPTWNYAAVHVHGRPRVICDPAWLRAQLDALTASQEGRRPAPWSVGDAPADYLAAQMQAIVGVEIAITRLEGKWKMSQNRSAADRRGVIAGLRDALDPQANPALAALVEARGKDA
jgi:transcriptional regulator